MLPSKNNTCFASKAGAWINMVKTFAAECRLQSYTESSLPDVRILIADKLMLPNSRKFLLKLVIITSKVAIITGYSVLHSVWRIHWHGGVT